MANKEELHLIRANIENMVGKRVKVTANKGRKRIVVREGFLEKTYSDIFVVKLNNEFNSSRNVSFKYIDVLTNTVELNECEEL